MPGASSSCQGSHHQRQRLPSRPTWLLPALPGLQCPVVTSPFPAGPPSPPAFLFFTFSLGFPLLSSVMPGAGWLPPAGSRCRAEGWGICSGLLPTPHPVTIAPGAAPPPLPLQNQIFHATPAACCTMYFCHFSPSHPKVRQGSDPTPAAYTPASPVPAYQGVDAGSGSQAVGAGGAVAAAVCPCPRQQAGAERQQRAAESQEQRHGAAGRRGQPGTASLRSHPRCCLGGQVSSLQPPPAPTPGTVSSSFGAEKGVTKLLGAAA